MNKYRDFDNYLKEYPDENGYFGPYGGNYLQEPELIKAFNEYAEAYHTIAQSAQFINELRRIRRDDYCISLEIEGRSFSSPQLAEKIEKLAIDGRSAVDFIIGGSLGLSQEVSRRADLKLSFSAMTFPHQMMRVILLEQIYRSFKIFRHETYHK